MNERPVEGDQARGWLAGLMAKKPETWLQF